ncbi:glycoside-pentoside-hexuronide (GPH):cation symporter [Salipaludibacillus sp. HK11]|uniref:glycoside-pentoside-hexuronide (GPH):cation symporter n=1 Tax=Salipaludibacillus sp. HK11 TaxID=3394320 RepID=UPI0039FBF2A4
MKEKRGRSKVNVGYSIGLFGQNILYGFMGTYMIIFYTDALGVSAALAGSIILFSRIFDAVNDPVMGIVADKTRTRWGKFRPYILFLPIVITILGILAFTVPENGTLIYIAITYVLFWIAYTALDIPYWSLLPVIAKTPEERNKINAVASLFTLGGALVVSVVAVPLIIFFGGSTSNPEGYVPVIVIIGVILMITCFITFRSTSEGKVDVTHQREKAKLIDYIRLIIKNQPLLLIMISYICFQIPFVLKQSVQVYFFKYVIGGESMVAIAGGTMMLFMIIGLFVSPVVAGKIGKKKTWIWGLIICSLFNAAIYFVADNLILILSFNALGSFGLGMGIVATGSMIADTVEYGEWKTGKRAESMIYSSRTFITKLSTAIAGGMLGLGLTIIGYQADTVLSTFATTGMVILMSWLPAVFTLLAIVPMKWYTLTEERHQDIVNELAERQHSAQ